ncbi:MAG: hypothetical protein IT319_08370 [Anaerolineae bacterium]|nr:hypothetical protein [Anaerolineae bacterium]
MFEPLTILPIPHDANDNTHLDEPETGHTGCAAHLYGWRRVMNVFVLSRVPGAGRTPVRRLNPP